VQREVTDIGAARSATKPATPPDTPPAGGAAGRKAPVVANDNQPVTAQKIAVGDTTGTEARSIKASGPKPPGNDPKGPPAGEPRYLGRPPEPDTPATPAPPANAAAAAGGAAAKRWGNWNAGDLMTGSKFKATQRDLYRQTVEDMADAMKANKFDWAKSDVDPIIVDARGKILQGHHRIVAARLAKVEIPESAIRHVPADAIRDTRQWTQVTVRPGVKP
jgi:hypothetical protein